MCWLLESAAHIVAFFTKSFWIHLFGGGTRRSSDRCCVCLVDIVAIQLEKTLSTILGVFGRHSCLCPEIPPLSNGPRLIPFGANCCMRCLHCELDPCFQFVFWLDVYHFVVAVCIVDASFVLAQNLAVCFVSGSLVYHRLWDTYLCSSLYYPHHGLEFPLQLFSHRQRPQTAEERSCHLANKSVSLFLGGHLDG